MEKMRRLPDTELEVMLVLWDAEGEVRRSYFDRHLKDKHWNINTINTYLSRLAEKGFLICEKRGKMNVYRPAVTQQEYLAFESRSVLDRLYGSSVKRFVAALYQDKKVDDKQLGELEEFLEELKRRG